MKNYLLGVAAALSVAFMTTGAMANCLRVNAAGTVGYVNVRANPDLNAPVITRWNNPSHGSDWGSALWCGQEYYDYDGRSWSLIEFETKSGQFVRGWVSDKVLEFVD